MDKEAEIQRVLYLWQVEKLSRRQIARELRICRKRVGAIIDNDSSGAKAIVKKSILDEYRHVIAYWYSQHPRLQAKQVYERLLSYGYTGSYPMVVLASREYRRPKHSAFHPLTFLPGEEAQVDWFFFNHDSLGQVAGFLYVLSYSRYAWGVFYPRTSFEFFLAGHMECFKHIGGLAHKGRYDNCKSVVIKRDPEIQYNPQFLDFARFFGFSIHACNPNSGNEKGRVERIIRDVRIFLYGETFIDLADLNRKFHLWLEKRNTTVHRSTEKTPKELLAQERLLQPPPQPYPASRDIKAVVSKTMLVEFDVNKYSVPSTCAGKPVDITAYPDHIEIRLSDQKVASHRRVFERRAIITNPLHAEKHLNHTPKFAMKRVLELITRMDQVFSQFIDGQNDDVEKTDAAYQIFTLLRTHSKGMVVSAVRELNALDCFKVKALMSLLSLPAPKEVQAVWPKNQQLLNLTYKERNLNDYDPT